MNCDESYGLLFTQNTSIPANKMIIINERLASLDVCVALR